MSVDRSAKSMAQLHWRKSSYSAGDGGECVEVAQTPASVHVRDSKNIEGPSVTVAPGRWAEFVQFAAAD